MTRDVEKNKQRLAAALVVGFVLVIAGAVVWLVWPESQRRVVSVAPPEEPAREVRLGNAVLKPIDLPVALLFDCYENARENVPPRTDTSKRQWSWEAPPLPMPLARAELGKAGASEADKKVLTWLTDWEEGWLKDYPTTTDSLWRLEIPLKETRQSFDTLFKIGLAMSFLDGDEHAVAWFDTAVAAATKETLNAVGAFDKRGDAYLERLAQTRALWQRRAYASLSARFAIQRTLCARGSKESRKSGHLQAVMEYYLGHARDALALNTRVAEENRLAGDLTGDDVVEEQWNLGLFNYSCQKYADAIPHVKIAMSAPRFVHRSQAYQVFVELLARTGDVRGAEEALGTWQREFEPAVDDVLRAVTVIELSKASGPAGL